jgi:hypothetical protein
MRNIWYLESSCASKGMCNDNKKPPRTLIKVAWQSFIEAERTVKVTCHINCQWKWKAAAGQSTEIDQTCYKVSIGWSAVIYLNLSTAQ